MHELVGWTQGSGTPRGTLKAFGTPMYGEKMNDWTSTVSNNPRRTAHLDGTVCAEPQ